MKTRERIAWALAAGGLLLIVASLCLTAAISASAASYREQTEGTIRCLSSHAARGMQLETQYQQAAQRLEAEHPEPTMPTADE